MGKSVKCTANRVDGRPCRAWAMRESDPPRCVTHAGNTAKSKNDLRKSAGPDHTPMVGSGFYDRHFSLEEIANLVNIMTTDDLTDEVAAARVAVRRAFQHLEQTLTASEYAEVARVIFSGTNTLVRLLRAKHDLADPAADRYARALDQALNELSEEWHYQL